jgi:predicted tellurium resistance membrane protein TerC
MDFSVLFSTEGLISVATLTLLEIVLGIDNIIFISIIAGKLPTAQQASARQLGLLLAFLVRIALLMSVSWLVGLKEPIVHFELLGLTINLSGRDLILLIGGLFLLYSSTKEIHNKLEGNQEEDLKQKVTISFGTAIAQIIALDVVFSFDSILTAIGLVDHVILMVIAVVISLGVMLIFASSISNFINKHPSIKMLGLSFLLMIGVLLVAEAFHHEIPKGYIYFSLAFSLGVEFLNISTQKNKK